MIRLPLMAACFVLCLLSLSPRALARPAALRSPSEPVMLLAHAEGGGMDEDESAANRPPHFIRWVGHFHPAMTVFPIAMLLGAALAELLLIVGGGAWLSGASRWCVIVGAIGAAITAPLGWAFAVDRGGSHLLETHRWLGTAAGAGALVILWLSEMRHRSGRAGWRNAFRAVLFLAVPLVMATGFFGGAMVYGIHAYDWNPPHHGHHAEGGSGSAAEPAASATPADEHGVVTVTMTDEDMFQPASITVPLGATVRWKNASKDEHSVTDDSAHASDAKDVALPPGARPFASGKIKPGGTFEQKFTVPGTYRYVCEPHEEMEMKGQVVVTAAR